MKLKSRLALLLCSLCSLSISTSSWSQSEIEIFSEMGDPFIMYLNQMPMNDEPLPRVLAEVEAGYYQLRIDFSDPSKADILKNNFGVEAGMRSTGKITLNRKGEWVVRPFAYVAMSTPAAAMSVPVTENTYVVPPSAVPVESGAPTETIDISMNMSGMESNESVQFTQQTSVSPNQQGESVQMNMNLGGGMVPGGVTMNIQMTTTGTMDQSSTDWGNDMNVESTTAIATTNVAPDAMSELDFEDYMNAIQDKSFEDSKLSTAKSPLASGVMLNASQIAQVMGAFSFESSRLDFAVFAHPHCVDPHNYYKTHGAFDFELTIDELNDALGQ